MSNDAKNLSWHTYVLYILSCEWKWFHSLKPSMSQEFCSICLSWPRAANAWINEMAFSASVAITLHFVAV